MNKRLKRFGFAAAALAVCSTGIYYAPLLFSIQHEQIPLVDAARNNRSVPVDVYFRKEAEMKAQMGMGKMPVAIISHGNTVKSSEYSFVANIFARLGYLVLSIQHDVEGDPKLPAPATQGTSYITRWSSYMKASANIDFVLGVFEKRNPYADYDNLTLLGHSQGGDISVFYEKSHSYRVARVITFDNLRMPLEGETETFTIRGLDGDDFKAEKGVLPCAAPCEKGNVTVEMGKSHHTRLNDTAPDSAKAWIGSLLSRVLSRPARKNTGGAPRDKSPFVPY